MIADQRQEGPAFESASDTAPGPVGAEAMPLPGARSGETFLVRAGDHEAVIRFYGRHPQRAAIDVSLLRLVRGLLPVPAVLEARTGPTAGGTAHRPGPAGPPYVLTERLRGVRLDRLLADPGTEERVRRAAGGYTGELLARLSGIPFLRAGGFAGPDLAVEGEADTGLEERVVAHRDSGGLGDWNASEVDGLVAVAARAQRLLDGCSRVCLCHLDLEPSNVLVDSGSGRVTGLVDWERARAGAPHADLGNLLRFETDEAFCHGVLRAYADRAPNVRADVLERAWAADLPGLLDLAAHGETEPARRAESLLRRMAADDELAGGRPAWL